MSPAHATLPVSDAQALPGRTVLHSNPTPRSREESFARRRRIIGFFPDNREGDEIHIVPDDEDTDPLPEKDYSAAPDMQVVEFDEQVMAHEWSPVPKVEMPQQPVITINYFERYPQHQWKLPLISEHPSFG